MLYSSFVIPHLDYCSVVWHNCGVILTSRVERIQNYALRVILKKPPRNDTKEMRSQMGLTTLEQRRLNSTLLQVHRCLHGHVPEYLSCKFVTKDSLFTNYPATRGATNLHLRNPRTNAYKSTFEYFGAKQFNMLPDHVKSMKTEAAFRKALLSPST